MKKFLSAIFVGIIFFSAAANVLAGNYVGNSNSKKFHYPDCPSVAKMNPANRVIFSSRDEATSQGYVPCKKCSP